MDDDRLIEKAWEALLQLSDADPHCKTYTWWAKLHQQHGLLMVTRAVFRAALSDALVESDVAEYLDFLRSTERKPIERSAEAEMLAHLDPGERTADW